jgi:PAS domain S-box-containing protein
MNCFFSGLASLDQPGSLFRKLMLSLSLLTLASAILFSLALYRLQSQALMDGIDTQLRTAATMAQGLVPDNYHDQIIGRQSVPDADYQRIVDRYNRLCQSLGLEYLWSLLVIDNQIVFTTSTSPDKIAANRRHAAFFEVHSNPELYRPTFARMTPTYQINDDKWGRIRVVLLPYKDRLGRPYLYGASVRLTDVDQALRQTIYQCLLGGLLLCAGGLMVSVQLARLIAGPLRQLTSTIQKIEQGNTGLLAEERGSYEQKVLAGSFNRLNRAMQEKLAELARQEELQRITLHSIGDAVITTDNGSCVTRMNPVAEHLTGWTVAEALGRPLAEVFHIVHATTRERVECPVLKVLRLGQIIGLANHTLLLARDGTEYQIADSAAPIRDPAGQTLGVVLVFHDVTEQYRNQEALLESQAMLKQILDTVPQSIFWKDKHSVYLGCNQVFARAIGLAGSEQIAGKTDFDLPWPRAEAEAYRADDAQVIASGVPRRHIIEPLQQADGTRLWIDTTKMPLVDAQQEVRGILGVYEDVTQRKRAEEALRALLEEKTVLLREVHHRVKNNMQIVSSLLHMQTVQETSPAALEVLQEAQGRVRSMALIHETLYRSQDLAQVDFASYIETLCVHLFRSFGSASAHIKLDRRMDAVALGLDQAVPCGLIINELISNAMKHAFPSGRAGQITLELRQEAEVVHLRVADNGVGLPSALEIEKTGTLGLRLLFMLAQQLKATVEVERVGGVTFHLAFPRHPG